MSEDNKVSVKNGSTAAMLFRSFGLPRLIAVFFWFAGIDLIVLNKQNNALYNWQAFIESVPVYLFVIRTLLGFAALTLLRFLLRKTQNPETGDSAALFTGSIFFACTALFGCSDFYFILGVFAVCTVFAAYAAGRSDLSLFEKLPFKVSVIVIAVIAVFVTAFVCVVSWCKHMTYNTACFDMGIFTQMFHSMRTDLTTNTTCERDFLLPHLNIHASYILYVLLPFYALFPGPVTLLIAQALISMSGLIPVVLIAKKRGFNGLFTVFISAVYIFNSGLLAPCFFHFHENCFLPALLMWLLFAVDTGKVIPLYILSALTCLVKEDAPLYIICIGLFYLADEKSKKRIHGGITALLALAYFVFIMKRLEATGSADMMIGQRFSNLVFGNNTGFTGILRNVLTNPSYFFSLLFSQSSLIFLLRMMMPLLFLPFATVKIHRYFLMLPMVIMNLVIGSGYHYAAEMGFHYTFGTTVLLIFMTVLNCSDMKEENRRTAAAAVMAAALITAFPLLTENLSYIKDYQNNKEHYQRIEATLTSIPADATVIAAPRYLPHIAERSGIYQLSEEDYVTVSGNVTAIKDMNNFEYFVLDAKDGNTRGAVAILESGGFEFYAESGDSVLIYRKAG